MSAQLFLYGHDILYRAKDAFPDPYFLIITWLQEIADPIRSISIAPSQKSSILEDRRNLPFPEIYLKKERVGFSGDSGIFAVEVAAVDFAMHAVPVRHHHIFSRREISNFIEAYRL